MWARSAQRPAPTTATRSSLLLILVDSSSRRRRSGGWPPWMTRPTVVRQQGGGKGWAGGGGGRRKGGRVWGRRRGISARGSMAAQPDTGVDDRVGNVDEKVHHDHEDRGDQD